MKLLMQTVVYTWFLGCLIYIWCELTRDLKWNKGTETLLTNPKNNSNWGVTIDSMTATQAVISIVYFTFTTVLTIGLGDFAFYSNCERVLGSFLMLGGVAYFTIIRDNFIEIDQYLRKVNAPIEQREELDLFFSMLTIFNNGILDLNLKN